MIIAPNTPASVGPQAPVRGAALDTWRSLRTAHGTHLWTTQTAGTVLDQSHIS